MYVCMYASVYLWMDTPVTITTKLTCNKLKHISIR